MEQPLKTLLLSTLFATTFGLAACGGGGSVSTSQASTPAQTVQDKWSGSWSGVLVDSPASGASPCYGPSQLPVTATLLIASTDGFVDVNSQGKDFEQLLSRHLSAHLPVSSTDEFAFSIDVIPPGGTDYDSRSVQFRITGPNTADLNYHASSGGNGTAHYSDCAAQMVRQ